MKILWITLHISTAHKQQPKKCLGLNNCCDESSAIRPGFISQPAGGCSSSAHDKTNADIRWWTPRSCFPICIAVALYSEMNLYPSVPLSRSPNSPHLLKQYILIQSDHNQHTFHYSWTQNHNALHWQAIHSNQDVFVIMPAVSFSVRQAADRRREREGSMRSAGDTL